jgi:hypothetical protein
MLVEVYLAISLMLVEVYIFNFTYVGRSISCNLTCVGRSISCNLTSVGRWSKSSLASHRLFPFNHLGPAADSSMNVAVNFGLNFIFVTSGVFSMTSPLPEKKRIPKTSLIGVGYSDLNWPHNKYKTICLSVTDGRTAWRPTEVSERFVLTVIMKNEWLGWEKGLWLMKV